MQYHDIRGAIGNGRLAADHAVAPAHCPVLFLSRETATSRTYRCSTSTVALFGHGRVLRPAGGSCGPRRGRWVADQSGVLILRLMCSVGMLRVRDQDVSAADM